MRRRAISSDNIAIADHEEGWKFSPPFSPPSHVLINDAKHLFLQIIMDSAAHDSLDTRVSPFLRVDECRDEIQSDLGHYSSTDQIFNTGKKNSDALFIIYFFIYASYAAMISEQDVLLSQVGFIDDDRRIDGSSWHMTISFIMINSHLLAPSTVLSAMDHRLAL
jgi:hypothetical protein